MPYAYLGASASTATFTPGTPANASGTTSITYAGGESVICTMSVWSGGPVVAPTLTDGTHTYNYIGTWGEHQTLWYCHGMTAGTYTLTYGATSDNVGSLRAYKFSGIQGAPVVSTGLQYFGTGAVSPDNVPVGSPNVSTVPALLFAVTRKQADSANVDAGTGFTFIADRLLHAPTPGTINGGAMHRRITSTGVVAVNFSVPPNEGFEEYNSATVAFAELALPVIVTQPVAQQCNPGATATFTVSATGTGSLSYLWQVSTNGGATFSNISGATSAAYTTPSTTVADNGEKYRCIVTDTNGSTTSADVFLHLFGQSKGQASKRGWFSHRGWLNQHNLDRSYRNVLFRKRITFGDPDAAEAASWSNWFFPAPGGLAVWNGTSWTAKPAKCWNGSAWTVKPSKRWTGSAWI